MNIDPENAEPTMKKAIEQMAYEWVANNYYYHYSNPLLSTKKYF